jgi:hypothetical protein
VSYRLGRRPPHSPLVAPRLALGRFLTGQLPPTPPVVDWVSAVTAWPMYGNDEWSCCVFSAAAHMVEAVSTYGRGTGTMPTTDDVLAAYSAVTGFDPLAGPPGANSTDQGTVIQDALGYWRRTGIAGHRIAAFAEVDIHDLAQINDALYLFGHLMLGVDLPYAALTQFDRSEAWHLVSDDGGIAGGHAINLGFDTTGGGYKAITWARVQPFSAAWWNRYVEEAWVVISPEWLSAAGANPAGVDLAALADAFHTLTGEQFPITPPVPAPPPHDPADAALVAALDGWAHHHHVGDNAHAAHAYLAWKAARRL